jgi:hypothetical protein
MPSLVVKYKSVAGLPSICLYCIPTGLVDSLICLNKPAEASALQPVITRSAARIEKRIPYVRFVFMVAAPIVYM